MKIINAFMVNHILAVLVALTPLAGSVLISLGLREPMTWPGVLAALAIGLLLSIGLIQLWYLKQKGEVADS